MNENTKYLLKAAANQITQLRHSNQVMAAKLEMFDKMMLLFQTQPAYQSHGMSEDIVYNIDKYVAEAEAVEAAEKTQAI